MPEVIPVNLVATAEIGQSLSLAKLAEVDGFVYDPEIYHCAYFNDSSTLAKVSVFASGKMISVGTKSMDDAIHDLNYVAERLQDLDLVSATKIETKLRNVVAISDIGRNIKLEVLTSTFANVVYEPEQFPGAIFHPEELEGAAVLAFSSGKIVFAGLKNLQLLKTAERVLTELSQLISEQ